MHFSDNWHLALNAAAAGLLHVEDVVCVDRVGRDLGMFKNEHEQIELRDVPALEDFPLVIIGSQMQAGCGTYVLVRVYLRIRVCKVNGGVVIDEILEGDTRVEELKLRIAEIEKLINILIYIYI